MDISTLGKVSNLRVCEGVKLFTPTEKGDCYFAEFKRSLPFESSIDPTVRTAIHPKQILEKEINFAKKHGAKWPMPPEKGSSYVAHQAYNSVSRSLNFLREHFEPYLEE
jgi:hypothetical protein